MAHKQQAHKQQAHKQQQQRIGGAGGVVFNLRGEVLLLQYTSGAWVFPKGHIDPGESELEAAQREVEEEAGVVTWCPNERFVVQTHYVNNRGELREIDWFVLETEALEPVLRETLFSDGVFVRPEQALTQLSFPEDRTLLARVLQWRQTQQIEHEKGDDVTR